MFHHEQAQTPLWPSQIFFCCLLPAQPGDGGETGIVSSHLVYQELLKRHPTFIRSCETHGVKVRRLSALTVFCVKFTVRYFHFDQLQSIRFNLLFIVHYLQWPRTRFHEGRWSIMEIFLPCFYQGRM